MADENVLLYRTPERAPLGRLTLAGMIHQGHGVFPSSPYRVYGRYAVVYLLAGEGRYADANGVDRPLTAGDLILVFPELPHYYAPLPGTTWSELYLVFEGPVFEFWRTTGLLDSARPVLHLEPISHWREQLEAFSGVTGTEETALSVGDPRDITRFLTLLTEMLSAAPADPEADWLAKSRAMLDGLLEQDLDLRDVAAAVGMGYETFRKRFQQAAGVSPARYRAERRLAAARDLLRHTRLTGRQIAEALGFSDEYVFSKRFKRRTGLSPREFRKSLTYPEDPCYNDGSLTPGE